MTKTKIVTVRPNERAMKSDRQLPVGTTLDQWKAEIKRLYPEARFQRMWALNKWHASLGTRRVGSWYGYYGGDHDVQVPSPHTQAYVVDPVTK